MIRPADRRHHDAAVVGVGVASVFDSYCDTRTIPVRSIVTGTNGIDGGLDHVGRVHADTKPADAITSGCRSVQRRMAFGTRASAIAAIWSLETRAGPIILTLPVAGSGEDLVTIVRIIIIFDRTTGRLHGNAVQVDAASTAVRAQR